jgi:RNA polymerase sigma-70 factor (ECF subfamily)
MAEVRTETRIAAASAGTRPVDWDRAYALYAPVLLRYVRRMVTDPHRAEELMQDTFERATRARNVPSEAELRPWLYRIATNVVVDHVRRSRRFSFLPFSGQEASPFGAFDADADAVRRTLRAIAPEEAAVLLLRLHEGFSRQEIAALLGVSDRAVKERLAKARQSFARAYRAEKGS